MSILASLLAGVAFGLAMAAPPGPMNAVIAEESVFGGWAAGFRAGLGAMTGDALFCILTLVGVVEVVEHAPTLRAAMVGVGGLLMCAFAVDAAGSVRREGASGDDDSRAPERATEGAKGGAAEEAMEEGEEGAAEETMEEAAEGAAGEAVERTTEEAANGGRGRTTGFRKALALSLTNPYQIVFWLTVGVGMLQSGSLDLVEQAPWLGDLLGALGLAESLVIETGSPALLVGFFGGIGAWITGYPATLVAVDRRSERAGPVVAAISAVVLAGFGVLFLVDSVAALV